MISYEKWFSKVKQKQKQRERERKKNYCRKLRLKTKQSTLSEKTINETIDRSKGNGTCEGRGEMICETETENTIYKLHVIYARIAS